MSDAHGPANEPDPAGVADDVSRALVEDVGDGDVSAAAIPAGSSASAEVMVREPAILCGRPWFDAVFARLGDVSIDWHRNEGDRVQAGTVVCSLTGPARTICTGERTALNFLQLLSGVATATRACADAVAGTGVTILDTRKTVPGLRRAQKYAVACGGGANHRLGLFDAGMLKENHLHAAGGIAAAVEAFRAQHPYTRLTVEAESLEQVHEALAAGADQLLLDNFTLDELRRAVSINRGRARLEASGGITPDSIRAVAETGVHCISVGSLTKDLRAVDLSLRFT